MERRMMTVFGAAALTVLGFVPASAEFEIGTSTKSRAFMLALESLSHAQANERGLGQFSEYFDGSFSNGVSAQPARGQYVRAMHDTVVPWNPPARRGINPLPGDHNGFPPGRNGYQPNRYYVPPPPRLGVGDPYYGNRGRNDNPYTRFPNYNGGYVYYPGQGGNWHYHGGYPSNGGFPYNGGMYPVPPPRGGYDYPPARRGSWGDGLVNFLNNVQTSFDNAREAIANWIAPEYPFVTRYIQSPYRDGRDAIPVYRNRHPAFDIVAGLRPPGYGSVVGLGYRSYDGSYWNGGDRSYDGSYGYGGERSYDGTLWPRGGGIRQFVPGYEYTSPPSRPGYGYSPGYGYFPLGDDGGRRAAAGTLEGYYYVPGVGYSQEPGYRGGPAFVPH